MMNIILLKTKKELLQHREKIEQLFYESFGQRSLGEVWDWAYLRNPNGEPVVALCYDGDALVGHYAMVPMPVVRGEDRHNSYISMTTMVAESHRKFGLFTTLAQEAYAAAKALGVDFVMGFPNSQSTPGFRKRLNWNLPEPDYVVSIDKPTLLGLAGSGFFDKRSHFSLDLNDVNVRSWRLSRPSGAYSWLDGVAIKEHETGVDLIWWKDPQSLNEIPGNTLINVLVTPDAKLTDRKVFDYQFGGLSLLKEFNPSMLNREMAISDLF